MHRWAAGLAVLALVYAVPAEAQQITYVGVGQRHGVRYGAPSSGSFISPGAVATFTAWYGLRAYSSAQCTGSVRSLTIRRASDDTTANINILASCDLDVASAATHCAATTCFVTEICDQVGSSNCTATHDLVQATAANQPEFVFNCVGARPCIRAGATDVITSGANMTPASGVVSLVFVGAKTGAGACTTARQNLQNNRMTISSGGGPSMTGGTSGTITNAAVADGAFVATVGVMNGASSFIYSGGLTVTGTVVGNTTAAAPSAIAITSSTTCSMLSFGIVDAVALSQGQANALVSSARGYWGF